MDSEVINSYSSIPPDDLGSIFPEFFKKIHPKIAIVLFMCYIFLNTTIFIDMMDKWKECVEAGCSTTKGIVMQATIISILYIILDILTSYSFI